MRRGLAVVALERQAERDFSLELCPDTLEQRQDGAGVEPRAGAGLRGRRELARSASQLGAHLRREPGRRGIGRGARVRIGAQRFEPASGVGKRPSNLIARRVGTGSLFQERHRLAAQREQSRSLRADGA